MGHERPYNQFILAGRRFTWSETPESQGRLVDVRSVDDHVVMRAGADGGGSAHGWLGPVAVIGSEFPLGMPADDPPYLLAVRVRDRHGLIHTTLVRSLVERCVGDRRIKRRPLDKRWRSELMLPYEQYPPNAAEREAQATAQRREEEQRRATESKMAVVAEKDAAITDRRCPYCGKPCPSYRITCKHCLKSVRTAG